MYKWYLHINFFILELVEHLKFKCGTVNMFKIKIKQEIIMNHLENIC